MLHKTKHFHNMGLHEVLCAHKFTDTGKPCIHLPSPIKTFLPVSYDIPHILNTSQKSNIHCSSC